MPSTNRRKHAIHVEKNHSSPRSYLFSFSQSQKFDDKQMCEKMKLKKERYFF